MRDRSSGNGVGAIVMAFWVGWMVATVGIAWGTYGFHPLALLYSAGAAVALAVVSLALVWPWRTFFERLERSSGEPGETAGIVRTARTIEQQSSLAARDYSNRKHLR